MECLITLGHSLTCCGSNQPIKALLPVVYIPVQEYVYLLNCGYFRGAATAASVDTYEYENSFSDKPHQRIATGTAVFIHLAGLERFARARSTRVYAKHWQLHLLSRTYCAGCVVGCRFFLLNPVSILIIKQQREIGGWPTLFGIGRVLLLFFFRSSVWLLPFPRYAPPFTSYWRAVFLGLFSILFTRFFSLFFFFLIWYIIIFYFISLIASGVGVFSES